MVPDFRKGKRARHVNNYYTSSDINIYKCLVMQWFGMRIYNMEVGGSRLTDALFFSLEYY